ncbi:MAG: DNA-directed RNA polymerase subunit beta' [Coprobacillus sp.]|nr:DNA-directed RNA polymerase subunit beta' [Coprobacillus sp.]
MAYSVKKISAIQVGLASPDTIRGWSHGEVTKPETINYRTQKPEEDGLYCERIFGPNKDYECHCGKYKKIRYAGKVCEICGVEVTSREVRRERLGHIELASPCTHIWYLKGIPSRIGLILEIAPKSLEEVVYYAAHICLNPGKSTKIYYKEIINEKNGREVFTLAIREILDDIDNFHVLPDSDDDIEGRGLLDKLSNPGEVFDFQNCANYVAKHAGTVFSEGAEALKTLLEEVDLEKEFEIVSKKCKDSTAQNRQKLTKRLECIESFLKSNNKPEWMILDVIPVIPPDLRPMLQLDGGRFATSDLNDLYRRVIARNNRLKKLIEMNAPQVILMNEKRMLQESVDALIDNGRRNKPVQGPGGRALKSLSSALKGKQGRFRQNLLGKRVDYSGRSVIAVGPDLKMYQCGIPREMAVQLLRPFIAYELLKRGVATAHKQADKIIDRYEDVVFDVLDDIISKHPVLLNRAPTLHRLGIQCFQPKLVDGRAIRLHPLVCTGFNADFDGDQMAVHVPLSKEAQEEALDLMLASNNILGPKDGASIVTPSQDMVLGNYYLTGEISKEELLAKAEGYRKEGDIDQAEMYEIFAASEGKIFRNVDDVILAYETKQVHLQNRIAVLGKGLNKTNFTEDMNNSYCITTVGKVIFNQIFPADFPYLNIVNSANLAGNLPQFFYPKGSNIPEIIHNTPLNLPFRKKELGRIIDEIFQLYDREGNPKTAAVLDKMKDQGFHYATTAGFTVSLADIEVVEGKEAYLAEGDKQVEEIENFYEQGFLTPEEKHNQVVEVWNGVIDNVKEKLTNQFKQNTRNPIYMMSDSGARGNISNIIQLAGMRGLMGNTSGGTIELPVKSCFREGLTVSEFFIATHGARKGGSDTALKTADSGYLTRRLVDVSQDVIVREIDCGTHQGFEVSDIRDSARDVVIVKLYDRLVGRYALDDVVNPNTGEVIVAANTMIEEAQAKAIVDAGITHVKIRSLFGCETKDGVCVHCYGRCLATGREINVGDAVGVMAAQSIGEPGTQLTLWNHRSGGIAQSGDITQGLPRVQELFEARTPKGEALISEICGTVTSIVEKDGHYVVTVKNDLEEKTYTTGYGAKLRVKKGDTVINGGKITEGAISPKKLLEVSNVAAVENYIVKEVQKVYSSQSIAIADKHIEVVVRQMLNKVFVIDAGDTNLLSGTRVNINAVTAANQVVLTQGKRPAVFQPLILGITKAALEVDSFLSAASFQETTKVLTDAAIKGKTDYLHGLKENVIVGRLIPAGRGLLTDEEEDALVEGFSVEQKMKDVKACYIEEHDRKIAEIRGKINEANSK